MTWQLPLKADTRGSIELPADSPMLPLKQAQFRRDIAAVLGNDWVAVANTPTNMLRDLYPKVYLYGPRAQAVEDLGNALLLAYRRHGHEILRVMPSYNLISSEESDYLYATSEVNFRPRYVSARVYLERFTNMMRQVAAEVSYDRDESLTLEEKGSLLERDLWEMMDFHLNLDLAPDTKNFALVKRDHTAWLTDWGLA